MILLVTIVPFQAYADTVSVNDPLGFFFSMKKAYFDFTEIITVDPVRKAELKIAHANEIDQEIQSRVTWNHPVPQVMVDAQKQKLEEAKQIADNPDQSTIFSTVKTALSNAFDKQEIRQIQADFSELRHESNQERKSQLAQALNDKINRPSINITCLGKIDSMEIANSENPYSALQERCKILKLVPESAVPNIVG